jgi:triphosphoribosyl-dephospho-CoA synthase
MNRVVRSSPVSFSTQIAGLAVQALIDEAELTPKPGLVDRRGSGNHGDMTLALMLRSAHSLHEGFGQMCEAALHVTDAPTLREEIGRIGREAETVMMRATNGVNTHRGAIWAIGLLSAAAGMQAHDLAAEHVAARGAELARLPDRMSMPRASNGERMRTRYGVPGARGEAQEGFPHVIKVGLPALRASRAAGHAENTARLDALVAIIAKLQDTCVLSRGGKAALHDARTLASAVMVCGGTGTLQGRYLLRRLEQNMLSHNASPGGAADLLAATLFLDALETQ